MGMLCVNYARGTYLNPPLWTCWAPNDATCQKRAVYIGGNQIKADPKESQF